MQKYNEMQEKLAAEQLAMRLASTSRSRENRAFSVETIAEEDETVSNLLFSHFIYTYIHIT